jgi:hypothetical protein
VYYNVHLYGQTEKMPEVRCFAFIEENLRGFDHLQEVARAKFAKWFETDLFNIISMENITILP